METFCILKEKRKEKKHPEGEDGRMTIESVS
jgi:hypothetical protein